ncbi:MAG: MBL fold metallo-hydrolase, partial [Eubacteriales bacterium]
IAYEGADAVVIDPGDEGDRIHEVLREKGLKVSHILLTHGHFDHIGALEALKKDTGALICIHEDDAEMLMSADKNLSRIVGLPFKTVKADMLLADGQTIGAGGMTIKVIHTPGHTQGGVCFEIGDCLFTGDTLFYQSIGRTDFPGSSLPMLNKSLQKLIGLDGDYTVYPGHGPSTMLDAEKQTNAFLRGL